MTPKRHPSAAQAASSPRPRTGRPGAARKSARAVRPWRRRRMTCPSYRPCCPVTRSHLVTWMVDRSAELSPDGGQQPLQHPGTPVTGADAGDGRSRTSHPVNQPASPRVRRTSSTATVGSWNSAVLRAWLGRIPSWSSRWVSCVVLIGRPGRPPGKTHGDGAKAPMFVPGGDCGP